MSHVLNYDGQHFRVEVIEVANPDAPDKAEFVGLCSDAFKELKDLPNQALSRSIPGQPHPTYADALRHAYGWIKTNWDAKQLRRTARVGDMAKLMYTVWLYDGDDSKGFDFEEFAEATAFAKAAEKSVSITKVGVTNNESPQYLTVWERAKNAASGK